MHIRDALKKTVPDQNLFDSNFTGLVKQLKETETLFEPPKEASGQLRTLGNYRGPFEKRPLLNIQGHSGGSPANRQRVFFRGARKRSQQRKLTALIRLLGKSVAACVAIQYGWMYTKSMERLKLMALEKSPGSYLGKCVVSEVVKKDFRW